MYLNILTLIFAIILLPFQLQAATAPTGATTRASTQLVYWFNHDEIMEEGVNARSSVQVTNTNPSEGVWIHVKIFSANVMNGDVVCSELNFVDFLTPNDTHNYDFENMQKNDGSAVLVTSVGSRGFVLITPVVSGTDLTAKSFQHMVGTLTITGASGQSDPNFGLGLNAMGRDAVDLATGGILPDNIPLDGVANGLLLLQPEELSFNILNTTDGSATEVVMFTFEDIYGEPGLLGYAAAGANATLIPFKFDYKESVTSCGMTGISCYSDTSISEDIGAGSLLCAASGSIYPGGPLMKGWSRIFVRDLEPLQNIVGMAAYSNLPDGSERGSADHMFAKGDFVPDAPAPECMFDPDGNPDCGNPECAEEEIPGTDITCGEFTEELCGEEIGCDNPNCTDAPQCQPDEPETSTGGGGGCSVAAGVTTATAAVNVLLPLLPLAGAFALRRMRRRNK